MNKKNISIFLLLLLFCPILSISPIIILSNEKQQKPSLEYKIEINALPTNVVINEILFDDGLSGDAGEFIELFNPTNVAIDISNWTITDEESSGSEAVYQFPENCTIPSRGFIIIFKDIVPGQLISPDDVANDSLVQLFETLIGAGDENDSRVENLIRIGGGSYDINLRNTNTTGTWLDEVFLYDATATLVDSVSYGHPGFSGALNSVKLKDDGGEWDGKSFERVWTSTSADWDVNGTGWAIKHTPTPGKLNGTVPEFGGEDPFGGGIPDNVVINEVYFDTIYDSGNSQINQFIELFNPTDHNINITGWTIEMRDGKWEFIKSKWADELGDSDILLIWPDNNQTEVDISGNWPWDPADDIAPWWQFWNNVDDMETWYSLDDFTGTKHGEYKNHELHNVTNVVSDMNLKSSGDYVILRNSSGKVVDVVAWGTGYSLPSDAASVIGDQHAGVNHGIGNNESLERIWQKHYPVCDFLYGPGVYHLPTPGIKIGQVPDEIEEGTEQSWDVGTGSFAKKGSQAYGLEFEGTTDNDTRIDVAKYQNNPKDHEPSGLPTGSEGVAFWHFQANNTIDPLKIWIYIDNNEANINLTTLEIYEWDYENENWVKLFTTMADIGNNITRVYTQTKLDITESEQLWIGVFASSLGGIEIPGFEFIFLLIATIGLIYIWIIKSKKIKYK
ncbi:MAG: lamin tail domain-containing protein [Candidatus Helarchaeota archaeon]